MFNLNKRTTVIITMNEYDKAVWWHALLQFISVFIINFNLLCAVSMVFFFMCKCYVKYAFMSFQKWERNEWESEKNTCFIYWSLYFLIFSLCLFIALVRVGIFETEKFLSWIMITFNYCNIIHILHRYVRIYYNEKYRWLCVGYAICMYRSNNKECKT